MTIEIDEKRLRTTIVDDGIPFNPFRIDEPNIEHSVEERAIGGLGIHLVRKTMDKATYHRQADRNVVTLVKRFEPKTGRSTE